MSGWMKASRLSRTIESDAVWAGQLVASANQRDEIPVPPYHAYRAGDSETACGIDLRMLLEFDHSWHTSVGSREDWCEDCRSVVDPLS